MNPADILQDQEDRLWLVMVRYSDDTLLILPYGGRSKDSRFITAIQAGSQYKVVGRHNYSTGKVES